MQQGLICLENNLAAKQTVVCAGNLILTKTRENVHKAKIKLLDRFFKVNSSFGGGNGGVNSSFSKIQSQKTLENECGRPRTISNADLGGRDKDNEERKEDETFESQSGSHRQQLEDMVNFDYSQKTNLLLLALTDFCPYFCDTDDLNGKQLRDVKKREIMSPFNMHFNVTNMIELVNRAPPLDGILE